MYEYKFVEVILERIGLFSSSNPNYKDVINANAKEGWRFVQIIATKNNMDGRPWAHEAIFERLIND